MVFLYIYDISMQRYEIILILPQVLCFFVFSCVISCSYLCRKLLDKIVELMILRLFLFVIKRTKAREIFYTIDGPIRNLAGIGSYGRYVEQKEQGCHSSAYPDDDAIYLLERD